MPRSRSVRTYRPVAAFLGILTGIAAILGVLSSQGGASPRAEALPVADLHRVGMNSCAARGCHGAVDSVNPSAGDVTIKGGAFTTWLNFDPHSKAYDVLLDPRSVNIAKNLEKSLNGKSAHEAELCLACHSTVAPPAAINQQAVSLKDGITCEACHGPAEVWQDKHLEAAWRGKPADLKAIDGMTELGSPRARAETCVRCHVGDRSRGMDMNHDLIAAGHPRLNFEYASYQAIYPKHWKEKPANPADFEARSWAIGEVVTAKAVLKLLAARAEAFTKGEERKPPAPEAVWPEFSEYECFACHHGLTNPSPLQKPGHIQFKPGKLPWATWPSTMLPELAKGRKGVDLEGPDSSWAKLKVEMNRVVPDPDKVVDLANKCAKDLEVLIEGLEKAPLDADRIASLMKELGSRPYPASESWDRATQQYLALSSLARAARELKIPIAPQVEEALGNGSKLLNFPPKYDSPRNVSPSSVTTK